MKILPFLLLCFLSFNAFAQVESGEWIYLVDTEVFETSSTEREFSPQVNPNNQTLVYDFGQARYQVIFTSDSTLLWKDLMDGASFHESGTFKKMNLLWLSATECMATWHDETLGKVTLFSDFRLNESRIVISKEADAFASMKGAIVSEGKNPSNLSSRTSKMILPK